MTVLITPSEKLPSANNIVEFENKISAKLPDDYVEFIKKYGDGRPEDNKFYPNDHVYVRKFLSIFSDSKYDYIIGKLKNINSMDDDRIPRNFIPIADDDFGNYILLDLVTGSIWFWDHELDGSEPERPDDKPYIKIAQDFKRFFDSLVPVDSEKLPKAKFVATKIDPEFAKKFGIKIKPG